jgi:hypothetical protein
MTQMNGQMLAIIALVVVVVYVFFIKKGKSGFTLEPAPFMSDSSSSSAQSDSRPVDSASVITPGSLPPAALLPKEVPVMEDFSQFSTDAILSNQNYLDPRNMIGYPETVGGTLRNANWQIRSEPPNPRDPVSIFNLSTIVPEQMRPMFEIQDSDYK